MVLKEFKLMSRLYLDYLGWFLERGAYILNQNL